MTLQEKYDELISRMYRPENRERYHQFELSPNKSANENRLAYTIRLAKLSLTCLRGDIDSVEDETSFRNCCSAMLRRWERLLNEQGWA